MDKVRVLCIEDNAGDARLVKELLADAPFRKYEFTHRNHLDDIDKELTGNEYDVVLLDLNLGDSFGVATFEKATRLLPNIPIIILTGSEDEALAEKIIQLGAQDYLVKNAINTPLLTRTIRYAIERNILTIELLKSKQLERQTREVESLDNLPLSARSKVTEQMLGIKTLHEYSEDSFKKNVNELAKIMDLAVEARLYKTDFDITTTLRDFADNLGYLLAGPQYVVEVYSFTLKEKMKASSYEASQIYLEEGRVLLLRIMGYLVAFYRKYAPVNIIFKDQNNITTR